MLIEDAITPPTPTPEARLRTALATALIRIELAELRAEAAELRAEAAEKRLGELEVIVRELKARIGKDSSNSSKPPSSDGPAAKAKKRRYKKRKPSGKKVGGQPGHKGVTRKMRPVEEADEVIHHKPTHCNNCRSGLQGALPAADPIPHQQLDIPPITFKLIHHWIHRLTCPNCGTINQAQLPPQAKTGQGPDLTAWCAMLIGKYRLSREQVAALLADLTGVKMSKSTVHACWERMGKALEKPMAELEGALPSAPVVNLDETGWREGGAKRWLWIAVAPLFVVFCVHARRSAAVLRRWFPDGYEGQVGSDRWSAYHLFDIRHRQLCWAHLGRDLQGIIDDGGVGAAAAQEMRLGEGRMFSSWWACKANEISRSELGEQTSAYRRQFYSFCECGSKQTGDDGWRRLGKDLLKKWPAVFNFLDRNDIDPTNNAAERGLRGSVIWRRTTQGTRTSEGSVYASRMLSVAETCRKQGRDILDFLRCAMVAHLGGTDPPSLLAPTATP
ncbi:MAG: IS66 family transposase [Roseibacillus sp.]|nr:IS66 family transposase [Roseibacillus sp.]